MRWEEISGTGASGPPGRRCAGPARGSPAAGGGGAAAAAAAARPFRRWSAAMGGRRTGSGPPRWGSGRSLGLRLRRAAAPCGWGRRGRAGEWRGGRDRGRSAAPPPPALPRPRRRARTGGGSPGVSSEKTAPAPPQRAPLPPQLSLWEGAGGTSPLPASARGSGGAGE